MKWEGGLGCKIYFLYNHKQYKIQDLLCIQYITVYFPSTLLLFFWHLSFSPDIFGERSVSVSVIKVFCVCQRPQQK